MTKILRVSTVLGLFPLLGWACGEPPDGSACAGDAELECSYFIAAFGDEPPSRARNVSCTCDDQEAWRCDD